MRSLDFDARARWDRGLDPSLYVEHPEMTRRTDRRAFLTDSARLGAALATLQATTARVQAAAEHAPGPQAGPNEVLRVAVCGVRGQGMSHVKGYNGLEEARIVAICDVDERVIEPAMKAVTERNGSPPKYYQDIRKLLEDKEIDAISLAVPNHWHALATIWGCQAGKDVYVEKPASHNVLEGRRMIQAAQKYGRIVQVGTQCRSNQGIQDAMAFLHSGKLGKVFLAKGLCYKPRGSIGHKPDGPVPAGLDYDLWTGPAALRPYNENRLHYNWHWMWNTGNGDLGNQGIHQMDLARWGLQKNEFPRAVSSSGGRYGYKDDGETPNTQTVQLEFDDCLLQFEVRGLATNDELGVRVGDLFYGTEGVLAITSYTTWQAYMGPKLEKGEGGSAGGNHFRNFLTAVKSRKSSDLNAPIEEGHLSSAYCHLGNIAYRLNRKLQINPTTESFVNDPEADAMLTRDYRAGFEIPSLA
jgi:predicted dehydrogenase